MPNASRSSNARAVLRPPVAGDLGWVVSGRGAIYSAEYGWDARFEALVAHVVAPHDRFGIGLIGQTWKLTL